uniref:NAB domain-containing protein n=1 Tax=Aegilops tauschii subsp. strangulata TaxID=200361 RepID=A0A453JCW2_AEGTS
MPPIYDAQWYYHLVVRTTVVMRERSHAHGCPVIRINACRAQRILSSSLLTDLHHRYLYLADRYAQSLLANAKSHSHHLSSDCSSDVDDRSSDAGSSLSYQPHSGIADDHHPAAPALAFPASADGELVVAELVMAWVDRDVLADEADRRRAESARKIDLQGSLLEVLESERLVLLGENAR